MFCLSAMSAISCYSCVWPSKDANRLLVEMFELKLAIFLRGCLRRPCLITSSKQSEVMGCSPPVRSLLQILVFVFMRIANLILVSDFCSALSAQVSAYSELSETLWSSLSMSYGTGSIADLMEQASSFGIDDISNVSRVAVF